MTHWKQKAFYPLRQANQGKFRGKGGFVCANQPWREVSWNFILRQGNPPLCFSKCPLLGKLGCVGQQDPCLGSNPSFSTNVFCRTQVLIHKLADSGQGVCTVCGNELLAVLTGLHLLSVPRGICFSQLSHLSPTSHGSYLGQINSWKQEWEVGDVVNWWRDASLCCETHQKSLPCRQKYWEVPDTNIPKGSVPESPRFPCFQVLFQPLSPAGTLCPQPGHSMDMGQQEADAFPVIPWSCL